ncbi:hypothetical protein CAOG_07586 [Capsaspora owczarzaki ATCC 30864]|uniref:F-box domain-containing protein n=1 Tax=Capsaspora owczarzaki (strain ATCC 30864) TaxID=595528 RepID=A0A0D2WW36_CAPO3|nr:hypothetical protein CAOG_07586 [Capsaspora owczarzaki ATCC 30864]KJE97120.1 hypothetical protein CAOG_007586 [Capsaspora owczarzaki ATCC 30864]|eukprot:XP_004343460.1 hypothetical protein CAOG_07586 [Capsaspora owczarzaki ATCC 30864]
MSPFATLPDELVLRILAQLPSVDVLAVSRTCHRMRTVARDPTLWRQLLFRDFDCSALAVLPVAAAAAETIRHHQQEQHKQRTDPWIQAHPLRREAGTEPRRPIAVPFNLRTRFLMPSEAPATQQDASQRPIATFTDYTQCYGRIIPVTGVSNIKSIRALLTSLLRNPPEGLSTVLFHRELILWYEAMHRRYTRIMRRLQLQHLQCESSYTLPDDPFADRWQLCADDEAMRLQTPEVEFDTSEDDDLLILCLGEKIKHEDVANGLDTKLTLVRGPPVAPRPAASLSTATLRLIAMSGSDMERTSSARSNISDDASGDYASVNDADEEDDGEYQASLSEDEAEERDESDDADGNSAENGEEGEDDPTALHPPSPPMAESPLPSPLQFSAPEHASNHSSILQPPNAVNATPFAPIADPPLPVDAAVPWRTCFFDRQQLEHHWALGRVCAHFAFQAHVKEASIIFLELCHGNMRILSISQCRNLRVWSLETMSCLLSLDFTGKNRFDCAVANDTTVCSVDFVEDRRATVIQLWNAETGSLSATLAGHLMPVAALAILPHAHQLLSSDDAHCVRLWNISLPQAAFCLAAVHLASRPSLLLTWELCLCVTTATSSDAGLIRLLEPTTWLGDSGAGDTSTQQPSPAEAGSAPASPPPRTASWKGAVSVLGNQVYAVDGATLHCLSIPSCALQSCSHSSHTLLHEHLSNPNLIPLGEGQHPAPTTVHCTYASIQQSARMNLPVCVHASMEAVYVGHADGDISRWPLNFPDGLDDWQGVLRGHEASVFALDSFGRSRLVSAASDFAVRVWSLTTHECLIVTHLLPPLERVFSRLNMVSLPERVFISENQFGVALSNGMIKVWQI